MNQTSASVVPRSSLCAGLAVAAILATWNPVLAQFGEVDPEGTPKPAPSRFDPFVRLVKSTIAPDSWDQVGGPGSIEAIDAWGLVVISQTGEVHEQIENLVHVVRRARREQSAGSGTKSDEDDKPEEKSVSLLVESPASAAARKRIDAALNSETTCDFVEIPLADVVEFFKEKHGIEIQIDYRVLDGVGIGSDTPITRKLSGVALRTALRLVLRDLDLTYMVVDDVLIITTPEEAEAWLVTRVYKVEDLAVPVE
jgi:hypothetical protein